MHYMIDGIGTLCGPKSAVPPPLHCARSKLKASMEKVLGPIAEWIELGARPDHPYELAWLSPDDAYLWMDVALACMIAGYMPPWRPKSLRTLKAPQFKDTPCTVSNVPFMISKL